MPKDTDDLDLSGLAALGADGGMDAEDALADARELQFLSGTLDAEEHQKQAAIRMDSMVGEILDNQERQTVALEAIATCAGRLVDLLEPLVAGVNGPAAG